MSESPNKTKHTPGPWYYHGGAVYLRPFPDTSVCIANPDREEPATAPWERDANARLIAAAPELLRELKSVLFFIESFKDHEETLAAHEVFSRFAEAGNWEQVQAIIANAEGKG